MDQVAQVASTMNQNLDLNSACYRFERKFATSILTGYEIEAMIKLHPGMFLEIYHPRYVNNVYFDSLSLENYFTVVDGFAERQKVRIRWYGNLFGPIPEPYLEVKIKRGLVGKKLRFPLIPFVMDADLGPKTFETVFRNSELPEEIRLNLRGLEHVLLNRYQRKYFQSADRKYRLTLDSQMEFYRLKPTKNTFLQKSRDHLNTVVELKYDVNDDRAADQVVSGFPFRLGKISKYALGIEQFL